MSSTNVAAIAGEALAAIDNGRQIASFSARHSGFSLDDAYNVTAAMRATRLARGERVLGRKIGFTNRTIWAEYGVYAPMWGYLYDRTVRNLADLGGTFPLAGLCRAAHRAGDRVRPVACAGARHGRCHADRLRRMDRAWLRAGAVDLPGLEILAGRHGRRERPAWRAADRAAPSGRRTSRGMAAHPHVVRHRSQVRWRTDGPRPRRQRDGRPALDAALYRWIFWRTTAPIHRSLQARSSRPER